MDKWKDRVSECVTKWRTSAANCLPDTTDRGFINSHFSIGSTLRPSPVVDKSLRWLMAEKNWCFLASQSPYSSVNTVAFVFLLRNVFLFVPTLYLSLFPPPLFLSHTLTLHLSLSRADTSEIWGTRTASQAKRKKVASGRLASSSEWSSWVLDLHIWTTNKMLF